MARTALCLFLLYCLFVISFSQNLGDNLIDVEEYNENIPIGENGLTNEEITQLTATFLGKTLASQAERLLQRRGLEEITGLYTAEDGVTNLYAAEENLCPNHTELILQGLLNGAPWAIQMVDATGRQPSAVLYDRNMKWLGSWEECLATEPVAYEDPANQTGPYRPFDPRYCDARIQIKPEGVFKGMTATVGMCFPSTCNTNGDKEIATQYLALLQMDESMTVQSVSCKETDLELTGNATLAIVICSVIMFAMVLGTIFDLIIVFYINRPRTCEKGITNPIYDSTIDQGTKEKISMTNEKAPLLGGNSLTHPKTVPVPEVYEKKPYKPGKLGQALLAFSMYTNGMKILDTKQPPGSLTAINGIRFLSMSWVILGHSLGGGSTDNYYTWISGLIKRWPFMAIANATPSVDTFFLLSGLLVAYLALKDMKKRGGPRKVNWFLFYFHRFWRLTPPYMLVMMVYVTCLKYWGDGPLWSPWGMHKDECKDSWWYNLLYINNLVKLDRGVSKCMNWGWYLANDMQFYWLTPLMLIPLYFSKIAGGIVCMAFILANLIATGVVSKDNEYYATQKIDNFGKSTDRFDIIYIKPYFRIGPYVVGVLYGYVLYLTNCKVRIPRILNLLGWLTAITIGVLVIYGPYTSDGLTHMTIGEEAFYNSAHRIAWGVAVGWVIFACATGYGGPINTLLSWPGIIPLSRLTYMAYLVHPIIQNIFHSSARSMRHLYDLEFVYIFLGHMWLSMAAAFVTSLAFESPMMGLEKILLAKYKK